MPTLDRLDSPEAFREQLDLSGGFNKVLRAQLAWLAGDKKAAQADVTAVAKEFADRPAISFEMLAKQAGPEAADQVAHAVRRHQRSQH